MARHVDPVRLRKAQLVGSAARIGDLLNRDPDRGFRLRRQWPELGEVLDRLAEFGMAHQGRARG